MNDNCYYCAENKPHPDPEAENFQRIRQNAAFSQERWDAQGILTRANNEIRSIRRSGNPRDVIH